MPDISQHIHDWLNNDPVGQLVSQHTDYAGSPKHKFYENAVGGGAYDPSAGQSPMDQMQPSDPLGAPAQGQAPAPMPTAPSMGAQDPGNTQSAVDAQQQAAAQSPLLQSAQGMNPQAQQLPQGVDPTQPDMQSPGTTIDMQQLLQQQAAPPQVAMPPDNNQYGVGQGGQGTAPPQYVPPAAQGVAPPPLNNGQFGVQPAQAQMSPLLQGDAAAGTGQQQTPFATDERDPRLLQGLIR